ncbi:uncharacterized protein LOC141611406 [Silene latifolia]|uniref:uncharacterized protein LOC141611406 n=1 Tax=Silene latifolia TaxID=37657 RepID=UPI003D76CF86
MDPCQFLKIVIGNLAIKFPGSNPPSSCYCRIKFKDLTPQSAAIPVIPFDGTHPDSGSHSVSACFNLSKSDVEKLVAAKKTPSKKPATNTILKVDVYDGSGAGTGCGFGSNGKLLGRVSVPLEFSTQVLESKNGTVVMNGWVLVGERKNKGLNPQVFVSVKVQPDPRFVFAFDGEPECSPQVFQVKGNARQPVFSCNFSCRQPADWISRSSSETSTSRSWLSSLKVDKDHHHHQSKERKGWSITIHDLSGSPVAAASMVTPFVPSQGSDWVSRSNPGAWLIMRPGEGTWKPWGRLESWRERAGTDGVGHRFELIPDVGVPASVMGPTGITLAQGSVPARSGGKFSIDITTGPSPASSPNSSIDFGSWNGSGSASSSGSEPGPGMGWWAGLVYRGFVMSSTVGGEGKASRPEVEVGSQHVACAEDAAVFVALAAAMDLSMDACRPFSQKLRKELRQNSGDFVV